MPVKYIRYSPLLEVVVFYMCYIKSWLIWLVCVREATVTRGLGRCQNSEEDCNLTYSVIFY